MTALKDFEEETFDIIICHNVLEYIDDKKQEIKEFARILKKDGFISIAKHNRLGRIMQMTVLLDDFDMANSLLDGKNGITSKFGEIRYNEDEDITKWVPQLEIENCYGIRTFWDLQKKQEKHSDENWQKKMMELERRVESIPEFLNIAFFHHIILQKKKYRLKIITFSVFTQRMLFLIKSKIIKRYHFVEGKNIVYLD